MNEKVGTLVVDSGPLIKGASLEKWSQNVVTIKEVLSEVRDLNTRRRLQVLPYELLFREPSHEAIRHVTTFAKKTGDYVSLSSVDLRLIALTYQLECELGPERGANLRKDPCRTQPVTERPKAPSIAGFYSGSAKLSDESHDQVDKSHDQEGVSHDSSLQSDINCVPIEEIERLAIDNDEEKPDSSGNDKSQVDGGKSSGCEAEQVRTVTFDLDEDNEEREDEQSLEQNRDDDDLESTESDDEDSWITPSNYQEACEKMGGALESTPNGITVGCITTDYAMQNVLLQLGLNVLSVDGMRVKQLRTYAMKCKGCFKVTSNTGLRFCPHCGNQTLAKVSVVLDGEDGTVKFRVLSQKQYSHKGLRYPLPLPKGGRHANNPILAPDQRETSKQRRTRGGKSDPLHPDYIAQSSPFAMKDVTSRGAQITFAQGRGSGGRKGWRNNPNAAKPKGRKK